MDLLPTLAQFYFEKRLGPDVRLSAVQSSILLALGLQRKTIEEIEVTYKILLSPSLADDSHKQPHVLFRTLHIRPSSSFRSRKLSRSS